MNLKLMTLVLGLFLSIPGLASATGPVSSPDGGQAGKGPCDCGEGRHHHGMHHKDWQAKMAKKEKELLTWVNTYTPDKKAEWTKTLAESKALHQKWHSPEFAKQREEMKKEKMAKFQALKKQYDEGKITKEEFFNKLHGDKKYSHWKTYQGLKTAVKANDQKKAAQNLNSLLASLKEHNKMLQDKMKK